MAAVQMKIKTTTNIKEVDREPLMRLLDLRGFYRAKYNNSSNDKEKLIYKAKIIAIGECIDAMGFTPEEDMVDRAEYERVENANFLAQQHAKGLDVIFDLRSKIDKTIEEIKWLMLHRGEFVNADGKVCIKGESVIDIIKRNFEE